MLAPLRVCSSPALVSAWQWVELEVCTPVVVTYVYVQSRRVPGKGDPAYVR